MQNQQRNLVLGFRDAERLDPILTPNEKFDPGFQAEGVTCAVCHVKDGAIVGPYGDARAPHPTRQDSAMTKGFGVCQRCHVVSGSRWDTFYRIPPCGTVAEIQEAGATPDCTGCHMPEVTRPLWAGGPPRAGRQHLWRGGHTPASVQQALSVDVDLRARPDGRRVATVTLTNVGADHYLPTGTPDRHLTLELELRSAEGRVLLRREHALERVILWRPIIVDLWDTRLPAKEPRTYELEFPVDAATSPATLDVRVRYHLLGEARRKRIGYENLEPISYLIYEQRVPVSAEAGN